MMRIVFAGTPEFAAVALEQLFTTEYQVLACLTQPDRPSGRGMKLTASPVKRLALQHDITVLQPRSLRLDGKYPDEALATQQFLQQLQPDVIIVAAYGLILPEWVLDLPKYGCLNIHASLLPRWRGAAPIQRAIEAGDKQTGITIMQMDQGLDTGAMLLQLPRPIQADDTASSLHDKLAQDGATALLQVLQQLAAGQPPQPMVQPADGVSYASKLQKSESVLDLNLPALTLERRVRAFDPFPGTTISLPNIAQAVKVWSAIALPAASAAKPGQVLAVAKHGIDIATGDGILRLLELQKPGARRQPVASFIQSWSYP